MKTSTRRPWSGHRKGQTRQPNRAERRGARYFQWQIDRAREMARKWHYLLGLEDEEKKK